MFKITKQSDKKYPIVFDTFSKHSTQPLQKYYDFCFDYDRVVILLNG